MQNNHATTQGDHAWFTDARFGMFIHWGLYAMAARHEWVKSHEQIPMDVYDERYFSRFDPDCFEPEAWAEAAADAGMQYMVVTSKHHEGFCLWDSAHTDYKATKTPAGRDLLRPMLDAFRNRGLRAGLYYSLLDWHHPDFVIDPVIGPYKDHPDREAMNQGRDQRRYAQYMRDQVRELLTDYGDIDVMWFDFSYPNEGRGKGHADWESEALLQLVRELRPGIILNDRLDLPYGWDIKTPEQFQPSGPVTVDGKRVLWEACQTFSGSWGYHREETSWKSVDQLVRMLVDTVSKDGNLLLNVGPTARGDFDPRALERLRGMGDWMRRHGRSIYGCGIAPDDLTPPPDCRYTYNATTNRLYCHVFAWPFQTLRLPGLKDKVAYAQFLHDGSEIQFKGLDGWQSHWETEADRQTLNLRLPVQQPDTPVPVIELFLNESR